jgi:hypothetical protein
MHHNNCFQVLEAAAYEPQSPSIALTRSIPAVSIELTKRRTLSFKDGVVLAPANTARYSKF